MEIHGFTESGSIDATIEGDRMTVPDDMANRHRQMIAELEALGNTIPAYEPPEPPPLTILYRSTFIGRMTASEASDFEAAMNGEQAYLRLMFAAHEYFDVREALVQYLELELTNLFGAARAAELLEPTH